MTEYKINEYGFKEAVIGVQSAPVKVTNNLGRAVELNEIVFLGGFLGNVIESAGIADGESGYIDITCNREIKTEQIEATDTFVVGRTVHFVPGGSAAAGKIVDTPEEGSVPAGKCLAEEGDGGAQTSITIMPFVQQLEAAPGSLLKVVEVIIDADATGGQAVDVPVGAKIVDFWAIATATSSGGTVKMAVPDGDDICTAIALAADEVVSRVAAGFDDSLRIVGAAGVELITNGSADRGIAYVAYI